MSIIPRTSHPQPPDRGTADQARLPASYEAARQALAECERIDECQDWADKAAALASYAKQAEDRALFEYAERIRARAVRRCGELLKKTKPAKGGDRKSKGGHPPVDSRKAAARDAGLSEHQAKQAMRVASVPTEDFERQVESPHPPTVTALAVAGTLKVSVYEAKDGTHRASLDIVADAVLTTYQIQKKRDAARGEKREAQRETCRRLQDLKPAPAAIGAQEEFNDSPDDISF